MERYLEEEEENSEREENFVEDKIFEDDDIISMDEISFLTNLKDPNFYFVLGKDLFEFGSFPLHVNKGVFFLKKSIQQQNIDSLIFYCKMLLKGDIQAKEYLKDKLDDSNTK